MKKRLIAIVASLFAAILVWSGAPSSASAGNGNDWERRPHVTPRAMNGNDWEFTGNDWEFSGNDWEFSKNSSHSRGNDWE